MEQKQVRLQQEETHRLIQLVHWRLCWAKTSWVREDCKQGEHVGCIYETANISWRMETTNSKDQHLWIQRQIPTANCWLPIDIEPARRLEPGGKFNVTCGLIGTTVAPSSFPSHWEVFRFVRWFVAWGAVGAQDNVRLIMTLIMWWLHWKAILNVIFISIKT